VNGVIEANTELGPSSWDPFDLMGINVTDGSGAYVPIESSGTPGQTVGVTLWSPGDEDIISSSIDQTLGVNGVTGVWIPQSLDAFIIFGGSVAQFARTVPLSWSINVPTPVRTPVGFVPGPAGPAFAGAIHVQDATKGCVGAGWWAGTPGAKTLGAGPLVFGNLNNAKDILSGPSWSLNIQPTELIGFQVIWNSSGFLAGPTVALIPGAALSRTTSVCR
jgi:hypothetical protein